MNFMTKDEIELYGEDAAEWLRRWDAGQTVWTIEMGGLGPGYEQCIAILTAEVIRFYLLKRPDLLELRKNKEQREAFDKERDDHLFALQKIKDLGCSGAQFGAACNVAAHIYRHGPVAVMNDERVKNRHIQIKKDFP